MSDPVSQVVGLKLTTVLAGFFGGLVRSLMMPGVTKTQALVSCVIGAVTANYVTPEIVKVIPVAEPSMGFAVGLGSMVLCEGIIRLLQKWRDDPNWPPK